MGDKAFDLSQLWQRGYPVVPGFVVPAIALWEFLEILGQSEPILADLPHSSFHLDVDNPHQLQQVAQQIRHQIIAAALPPAWASSLSTAAEVCQAPAMILHPSVALPAKSWQVSRLKLESSNQPSNLQPFGILESHTCLRQPEAVALALKRVWAELFRARSLFYWQRHGISIQQLTMAVLVQPLWDAIASGTLTLDRVECNIQATWGNGKTLLKGEVLPDTYQLQVATGTVKTQALGSKTRAYRVSNVSATAPEDLQQGARDWGLGTGEEDTLTRGHSDAGRPLTKFSASPRLPLWASSTRPVPLVPSPSESGLQAYLLSEEQQKQYALEEKYLKQLIELCQQLTAQVSPAFYLEWTICQPPGSIEPQLYITHFSPQLSTLNSKASMSSQPPIQNFIPQIFRGLPAAAGRVTAPAQVIIGNPQNLEAIPPGRILVAPSIAPDWLPLLKSAAGIVTEHGGMTSHAAIIARELGIPAVVSAAGVTQLIQTGEFLMVDGDQGEIYRVKDIPSETESLRQLNPHSPLPPIATQLFVNLSLPDSLERIVGLPVDGVGLLRSELMMLEALENLHPSEWLRQGLKNELIERLAQLIVQFAAAFAPRPVFYRSLDWRSHEFQFLAGDTSSPKPEVNPIVGLRGTRRYLSDPTYFDLELAALEQVLFNGYTNVQLILPFVRAVEEFTFCRRRVEQAGLFDNPHFQLWIMAEVPSVLFLLPDYVKAGVQGISIGTNDLTQLLLATDRDQEQLGSTLNGRHPAVKQALKQIIQMARTTGIPCSICGQAPAQYPELIDLLVKWGITSISVDVNDVEGTYTAIARAEQRLLLEAARQNQFKIQN